MIDVVLSIRSYEGMRSTAGRFSCPCWHAIAPCDAPITPSVFNPIPMIHLRLPFGSSATPAAWPCGAVRLRNTVTPDGTEHSLFGRHSSSPRLSGSPTIACVRCQMRELASKPRHRKLDTGTYIGHRQPSGRRNHMHGQSRVACAASRKPGLIPHSIARRESVCRITNIRFRAVGAYLRTNRRHTAVIVSMTAASAMPMRTTRGILNENANPCCNTRSRNNGRHQSRSCRRAGRSTRHQD
jgi:hypothetical protein